jgi:hypothetical protein
MVIMITMIMITIQALEQHRHIRGFRVGSACERRGILGAGRAEQTLRVACRDKHSAGLFGLRHARGLKSPLRGMYAGGEAAMRVARPAAGCGAINATVPPDTHTHTHDPSGDEVRAVHVRTGM